MTTVSSESSPQALRSDIESTRQRIDQTMDALGNRLHGRHLIDEVVGAFRKSVADAGEDGLGQKLVRSATNVSHSLAASVEKNPLPVILIGAGVAWLAYKSLSPAEPQNNGFDPTHSGQGQPGQSNRPDGAMAAVKEPLSDAGQQIGEKAASLAHAAGNVTDQITAGARAAYAKSRDAMTQTIEQKPIELGFGCLAAGLLAGLLIPTPPVVNRMAGAKVAGIRHQAHLKADELVTQGEHLVTSGLEAIKPA